MKLLQCTLGLLGAASCALAALAGDSSTTPTASEDSIVQGAYIVELDDDVDTDVLYDGLRAEGLPVSRRMDLKYKLFRGASFRLDNTSEPHVAAARIAAKPQIKNMWPVRKVQFPKPEPVSIARNATRPRQRPESSKWRRQTAGEDTYSTHVMAQVDKLRAEGYTGKGVRIGVVDTGIDYRHPALGGCFGPGCLVEYGYDFTGDNYWHGAAAPEPDDDPLDTCQGHGTHVAGIIMAQENELGFTGVAPDVTLGMYKVSGCPGYTTNEIIISAFYMAYEAGSDIISCSAGDDSGWAGDASAVAASRIAAQGVPVIVAGGNSGGLGLWQTASPASGADVAAIGSVENTVFPTVLTAGTYSSSNGTNSSIFGWRAGFPALGQTKLTMPLWSPISVAGNASAVGNSSASGNDACEPLPEGTPDLSDKIALVHFTIACTADIQGENIAAKGGKYIMFVPENEARFSTIYVYSQGIEGVGLVPPRPGKEFSEALAAGQDIVLTITPPDESSFTTEDFSNGPRAGYISSFSSWGPTWDMEVKPQFLAPGGNILSTWIWDAGEYAVNPGTSMSTPFVAGVYALVAQARGKLGAKTLRNIMSATSKPNVWYDESAHDILAPVAQQGAGLIQAYDAAHGKAILSVSSFSFNDSDHFAESHTFSVENTGDSEVTFEIGHVKAATVYTYEAGASRLYPTRSPQTAAAWASIKFESTSISVPGGGSADVSFVATQPSGLNGTLLPVYSGYITLNGTNGENLSVPYLGVAGSLHDTPVLTPGLGTSGSAATYLTSSDSRYLFPVPANQTFTMPRPGSNTTVPPGITYPKVVILPSVGMRRVRVDIVAAFGNSTAEVEEEWFGISSLGQIPDIPWEFVPHIGFTSNWYGYTSDRTVIPAGTYRFIVSALRIFGDADTKEDWDRVDLPQFHLRYV